MDIMKRQVNSGKTLSFCSSAPFSEFINVTIDNEVVNENNYDKKEGSTIITLHSEFLSALSVGVHTLSINSESGSATTGFVIEKAPLEPITDCRAITNGCAFYCCSFFGCNCYTDSDYSTGRNKYKNRG